MANTTKPLTNTEVKQAKPKDKEYNLADGGGLALRIKPNGSKTWLFNYSRPFTKKRANIGLGLYPDVPLARAREVRKEYRELLANNIDPKEYKDLQAAKNAEAYSNTFKHVASLWLEVKKTKVSVDHAKDTWRSLELHIFPHIGNVPIHKLKAKNTIAVIQPIAKKGSLETVKRLCQRINEVMTYAVNAGIIDTNPLSGIYQAFGSPNKNFMPTIKPEQLPEFMKAISRASIKTVTRNLIEWQLHTMVRPGEAVKARWNEINLKKKVWNIPAETMKKKRPHAVPLSRQAIEILKEMEPISRHREYVFPSHTDPKKHANASTANMAIKRMGYGGVLVAHGLRALASTVLNEQGFYPDVIEAALAHVDKNDVRRAYNRAEYFQRRVKLMDWWSGYIEQAATNSVSRTKQRKGLQVISK